MGFLRTSDMLSLLLLFAMVGVITFRVHAQSTHGFISIDCGLGGEKHAYIDNVTGIPYTSDAQYIDSGVDYNISSSYANSSLVEVQFSNLRSFPDGSRNCYTLNPVVKNAKYLVRATFFYGNYDGLQSANPSAPLTFDLHIDVNHWVTVKIKQEGTPYRWDAVHVAKANFISACLINTGTGTPFISALELRPLQDNMYHYANTSQSLVTVYRNNVGGNTTERPVRYPDDPFDRIWFPWSSSSWRTVSTDAASIKYYDAEQFFAPIAVMKTAAVPINSSALTFAWTSVQTDVDNKQFYANLHFMELLQDTKRAFNIYVGDWVWHSNFTPKYLLVDTVFSISPLRTMDTYNWSLDSGGLSKLPPIFNALEVYSPIDLVEEATDENDVASITAIKEQYQIKKNWMGDPCVPVAYSWNGLKCSSYQITSLDLSFSNLTGEITKVFGNLSALEYLDLSGNNLTGQIPVVLDKLPSLKVLDIRNNLISGPIPDVLIAKSQDGLLTLRVEGNPDICSKGNFCGQTSTSSSKKFSLPIVIVLSVVPIILVLVGVFIFCILRRSQMFWRKNYPKQVNGHEENGLQLESRQFTCVELKKITNNFTRILGKGGFGNVYHGCLEDGTEVAIKMRSESSSQGTKEFLSEARHLSRVHHRNLLSMIGYCNDGNCLALVYEFMSQGALQEHLRGNSKGYKPLTWRERLQIALESAQGLEYLHKGCKPPLIHRDVKTANILLSGKLEAKIADFGLSKDFHNDINSHISTAVVGTPGYLDPEYYNNFQISEKSDIYSFGVVLFELITGQAPVVQGSGCTYIVNWVRQRLAQGNIEDIVDTELLQAEYDVNSLWKCTDVALKCTTPTSHQRPSISDVVMELNECLTLEASCHEIGVLSTSCNYSFKEISEMKQNNALDLQSFVKYR